MVGMESMDLVLEVVVELGELGSTLLIASTALSVLLKVETIACLVLVLVGKTGGGLGFKIVGRMV